MLPVMRDTQSAPGRLELIREFVNTRDIEEGTDELLDTRSTTAWLRKRDLIGPDEGSDDRDRDLLITVREMLRELLLDNNAGREADPAVVAGLNQAGEGTTLQIRFGEGSTELVSDAEGVAGALGELLAIVHASHLDDSWGRLKACPAEDCQWAFYDRSRNRSATWCQMGACGNRSKARAFRARRRPRLIDDPTVIGGG